jgi:hypothetical protein
MASVRAAGGITIDLLILSESGRRGRFRSVVVLRHATKHSPQRDEGTKLLTEVSQ